MIKICRLCGQQADLSESHIIPKFVTDWLKKTSATGYLRSTPTINRRSQNGIKEHMLCSNCETMFNRWETPVANNIFYPYCRRESVNFKYGPWLLKFAVSVSWRALTHYFGYSRGEYKYSDLAITWINRSLKAWKEFLLDKSPNPGSFEQHLLLVDIIESASNPEHFEANINRYLTRVQEINMAHSDGDPRFIYVKMGKMILLGFIHYENPNYWKGTKIHVKQGTIGGDVTVPEQFFEYLNERADTMRKYDESISSKQKEKIHKSYMRDLDHVGRSETFQAIDADVSMFGRKTAFKKTRNDES
jgi:hypothetical protein